MKYIHFLEFSLMAAAIVQTTANAIAQTEKAHFILKDETELEYILTKVDGFVNEKIVKWKGNASSVIWEFDRKLPSDLWADSGTRIIAAKKYGNTYCIVTKDGIVEQLQYIRVDTATKPSSWLRTGIPWQQTDRYNLHPPLPSIESASEITLQGTDNIKRVFQIFPDGRLERDGVQLPGLVTVNGKVEEHKIDDNPLDAKRVSPQKTEDKRANTSAPLEPESNATKNKAIAFIRNSAGNPNNSTSHLGTWPLWAGIAAAIAVAAGWLLFRGKGGGRKT